MYTYDDIIRLNIIKQTLKCYQSSSIKNHID